jgi:DNA-binding protein H-NS
MTSKAAIARMNYSQLLELRKIVDEAIENRHNAERQELNDRLSKIAKLIGGDVKELPAKATPAKRVSSIKGKKVKPKYRNPAKRGETWTGRGRQPRWLVHEIGTGETIESFLIKQ